ncbi:AAA family ATPase [Undibacterium terreum]|uniref:OmpR/PhoB-type domain-containing protein n=1 Tax=Undibacterium terreum TaxID=1224302 RepID=A0A916XAK1_9BURK|nr:AAA family ATPase [Undibacterium terreum]GGC59815.1 hypothetical protein GCM10011396_03390 [Undibacterium terreum]
MAYAKISVPRFSGILQRPRLFQLLDEMNGAAAIWVSGPPGAGKTSLVGSYLEAAGAPVLWYHVDRSDSDLSSFFSYFSEALRQICPPAMGTLPRFASEQTCNLPLFYSNYFRRAFEYLPAPCVIVLDDYHQAASNILDHFLKAAILELPSFARIFITSRTPAPSLLARERANRSLGIVDWSQLRFDVEEITRLCDTAGVRDENLVARLSKKTLGWVAGLVLLLERGRAGNRVDWPLSSGHSPGAIFNYFAEEIFELEEQKSQKILLSLAFLPQYTGKMAMEITKDPGAGAIVEELSRKNFFTDKRNGPGEIYRFHALFREFLVKKARAGLPAEELRQLQKASAQLMEQSEEYGIAVDLYRELEEFSELERIVLQQADGLIARAQTETIARWIHGLPYAWIEASPELLYWLAKTEFYTDPLRARQLLERSYPGFVASKSSSWQIAVVSEILHCYVNQQQNFQGADSWIDRIEDLLQQGGQNLPVALQANAYCGLLAALMFRQPHRQTLSDCAHRLTILLHQDLEPKLKISVAASLVEHYAWRGQFAICEDVLAHVRAVAEQPELAPLSRTIFGLSRLQYFAWSADYPAAKTEFAAMKQGAIKGRRFFLHAAILLHYIHACLSTGHLQEADALLAELDSLVDPRRSMDLVLMHMMRSWSLLLHGNPVAAKKEAQRALALYADSASAKTYAHSLFAFAMACAIAGEYETAADAVNEARCLLQGMHSPLIEFHALLIESHVQLQQGRRAACRQLLQKAFLKARQEGLLNTLQWIPELVTPLCVEALDAGIEAVYVTRLIRARQLDPPDGCDLSNWPWPVEIRALGNFEISIEGELLHFTHKAQKKPLEFLKLLIAHGGRNIAAEKVADALWPDADGDAAQNSFDSTLHRLRKLLRRDDAVTLSEGKLALNPGLCWLDIWALEKLAEQTAVAESAETAERLGAQLLHIYRGTLLSGDTELAMHTQAAASHRAIFERSLMELSNVLQLTGKTEQAIALLERGMEHDAGVKLLPALLKNLRERVQ